jgi:hypothetical protein
MKSSVSATVLVRAEPSSRRYRRFRAMLPHKYKESLGSFSLNKSSMLTSIIPSRYFAQEFGLLLDLSSDHFYDFNRWKINQLRKPKIISDSFRSCCSFIVSVKSLLPWCGISAHMYGRHDIASLLQRLTPTSLEVVE